MCMCKVPNLHICLYTHICHIIILYMSHHHTIYVKRQPFTYVYTRIYVTSSYYICHIIILYMSHHLDSPPCSASSAPVFFF